MFVAGLNYSNSTALFLTFWLAGFVLVGLHRCHRNLLGIALQGATAVPTFAGGAGELELTLENPAPLMRLRIEADLPGVAPSVTDIAPRSAARLNLALPTTVRGRLLIDGLRLTTALPFGLFRAWTWVYLPLELIVYPRARGFLPLPTVAGVTPGKGGTDVDGVPVYDTVAEAVAATPRTKLHGRRTRAARRFSSRSIAQRQRPNGISISSACRILTPKDGLSSWPHGSSMLKTAASATRSRCPAASWRWIAAS